MTPGLHPGSSSQGPGEIPKASNELRHASIEAMVSCPWSIFPKSYSAYPNAPSCASSNYWSAFTRFLLVMREALFAN